MPHPCQAAVGGSDLTGVDVQINGQAAANQLRYIGGGWLGLADPGQGDGHHPVHSGQSLDGDVKPFQRQARVPHQEH